MTLNDIEIEPSSRRTFPWKGRPNRATQPQQSQLLQSPEFISNGSSSDVSYWQSDSNSLPSRISNECPGDIGTDKNQMTRAEPVDLQDFHDYFTDVPLDDPVLQVFQCHLRNDDLVFGQLVITKSSLCFKSDTRDPSMTKIEFRVESIKSISLVRPGRWKPRMIQMTLTNDAKHTFTSFLPSTTERDAAYQMLMDIWQPHYPTASTSTPTPTSHLPPSTAKAKSPPECDGSDTTSTSDNNKSIDFLTLPAPTTPTPSSPFKLFQRKRAQTVAAQPQQRPQESGSGTSSHTLLTKSLNTHVIWNNDQPPRNIQLGEADPPKTSTAPPAPIQQIKRSVLSKEKKKQPSSPKTSSSPSTSISSSDRQHLTIRINTRTLFMITGLLFLLSHVFLTYQFYHMTHLITTRQLQQHQVASSRQQQQGISWISSQLEKAVTEVQHWEKETLQQKKRLMNMMIPT